MPKLHPFFERTEQPVSFSFNFMCDLVGNCMSASSPLSSSSSSQSLCTSTFHHLIWFDVDDGVVASPMASHSILLLFHASQRACVRVSVSVSVCCAESSRVERREKYSIIQLITITNNCTIFHLHSFTQRPPRAATRHTSIAAPQRLATAADADAALCPPL